MSDLLPPVALAALAPLESFGHALVERFGILNFWTAALLGGAVVLDRVLARRTRASWRIALYAPVALRILLPLDWSLRLASTPSVVTLLAPLSLAGTDPSGEAAAPSAVSSYAIAALAYVMVAALLAARAILARVQLGHALAGAEPVPDPRHHDVPCPIVQHDELGPMAVGVLAPRIVLPRRLLAPGEEHTLECVLRHEAAHLRRRDAWLSAGMQLLAIAAWPVLPLWIAIARVRQLIELACDEAALAGADRTERHRYGHALLDMAEWRSFAVVPLGAGELNFGSTLHARIEALASERRWPVLAQVLALSLAPTAMLGACGGSTRAPASAKDDDGYGYEFETVSAKEAAPAPASAAALPLAPGGRIPPETIEATLRGHAGAFKACYDAGLQKDPKLAGLVTVKFAFGVDGVITEANAKSTLPDEEVGSCVARELRKVAFPKSPGGVVTVVYPIQFAP